MIFEILSIVMLFIVFLGSKSEFNSVTFKENSLTWEKKIPRLDPWRREEKEIVPRLNQETRFMEEYISRLDPLRREEKEIISRLDQETRFRKENIEK